MSHKDSFETKTLGRRDLLKALAATGGAITAATILPGKWTKPVIEAGVLPAHAASSAIVLSNLTVPAQTNSQGVKAIGGIRASVDYNDAVGGIDDNAELSWTTEYTADFTEVDAQDTKTYTEKLANLVRSLTSTGFLGTITFPIFGSDFILPQCGTTVKVTVNYLKASDGRKSNVISNQFTYNCD